MRPKTPEVQNSDFTAETLISAFEGLITMASAPRGADLEELQAAAEYLLDAIRTARKKGLNRLTLHQRKFSQCSQ